MGSSRDLIGWAVALVCLLGIGYLDSLSELVTQSLLYGLLCLAAGYRFGYTGAALAALICSLVHGVADGLGVPRFVSVLQNSSEAVLLVLVGSLGAAQRAGREALLAAQRSAARAYQNLQSHLEQARVVQSDLLGVPPRLVGPLDLSVAYQVAVELGGDLFFVKALPSGLFFFVGDVSGKGPRAALAAASLRTLLGHIVLSTDSPAQVLAELQSQFVQLFPNGLFVTAFCAVADWQRQRLTYANAGHDPPLLRHPGQERLEELLGDSLPIGVEEGEQFREHRIPFQPGQRLLVYTDGLLDVDSGSASEVEQALLEFSGCSRQLAETLVQRVPQPRSDDVMVLVLTFTQGEQNDQIRDPLG